MTRRAARKTTPSKPATEPRKPVYIRGDRLRAARELKGWRQRDVTADLSLTDAYLSQLERGDPIDVRVSTLVQLCRRLGVSADFLLGLRDS